MTTDIRAADMGGISISQDVLVESFSNAPAFKAAISTLVMNHLVEFEGVHPVARFTDPATFEAWYDARLAAARQDLAPTAGIAGDCPNCGASVGYDDWLAIDNEPTLMGCPQCRSACAIDAVFPPANASS